MKKMKKLAASLLALVMVAAMMVPAMAAADVKLIDGSNGAHKFTVHPIFKGEPAGPDSLVPTTIEWADRVNGETFLKALIALNIPDEENNIFKNLVDGDYNSAGTARNVAKVLADNFTGANKTTTTKDQELLNLAKELASNPEKYGLGNTVEVDNEKKVPTGYCVIKDHKVSDDTDSYMMWVIGETTNSELTISPKVETSLLQKQVWDPKLNNGSGGWASAAVYSGGGDNNPTTDEDQAIRFRITVTLPDMSKYGTGDKAYNMVLHDTQDVGLDYVRVESVKILRGASAIKTLTETGTDKYWFEDDPTCTVNDGNKACDFEIGIDSVNTMTVSGDPQVVSEGDVVEVIYIAKANSGIKFGDGGNNNNVKLKVNGDGSWESNAKVYELLLEVNKVDSNGTTPLSGARFTLYKTDVNGNKVVPGIELAFEVDHYEYKDEDGKIVKMTVNQYNALEEADRPEGIEAVSKDKFILKGLEAGTYILEETTAPKEYNKIDDIKVVIGASITAGGDLTQAGTVAITADGTNTKTNVNVNFDVTPSTATEDGKISTAIVNNKGTLLPQTGGMGTTLFYIGGAVLAIGAVVLLITKRRVGDADDE